MRKQLIENAAFEVATQVRTVEDTIEAALIEIADLQAEMVHARATTKAGFVNTHAAFEQLSVASSSLIAARGGIAHCHAALADACETLPGLRTESFGDNECPPNQAFGDLRVVA